jgi:hypothetical protein
MPDKTRATNESTETLSRTALKAKQGATSRREDQRRCQRGAATAVLEMVLGGSSTHVATVLTAICQNTGKGGVDFRAETRDEGNQVITYQELWARVNEVAAMLRDFAAGSLGIRISCTALWP